MTKKEEEEKKRSGSHTDNDFNKVQKIMKDNNLPTFYTDEDDDNAD